MRQQATFVLSLPSYSLVSVFPKLLFSVYSRHVALYTPINHYQRVRYLHVYSTSGHTHAYGIPACAIYTKWPKRRGFRTVVLVISLVDIASGCIDTVYLILYTTSSAKPMNVLRESDEQSETVSDCSSDSFKQVIVRGLYMIKVMFAETTTKLCFYIIHIFALV